MTRLTTINAFKDLSGHDALTPAEVNLIAACREGDMCTLSPTRPDTPTPDTQIRASLLRLIITGGTPACGLSDFGVWLHGAYIIGTLDLDFATALGMTTLKACTFAQQPQMMQACLHHLSLQDSHLPGLNAPGLMVTGPVYLQRMTATTTVDISGAQITGQLDCTGAKLDGKTGPDSWGRALNAQAVTVGVYLFLRNLTATGTVDVNGAQITGQLNCVGASLDGKGGDALNAERLVVKQGFFWRGVRQALGQVSLANAAVGDLVDDMASWPDDLYLDGFTYDRITAAPTDARARLLWLRKGSSYDGTFFPQPYTQLAKVLSQMGHDREARIVLMEREQRLAAELQKSLRAGYLRARNGPDTMGDSGKIWLQMQGARLWSAMTYKFAGYGYAPQRALIWSIGLTLFSMVLYFIAYRMGWMVPTAPILLTSPDWVAAFQADPVRPALHWTGAAATHYETFYALPYAFDVYLPIVDLGYGSAWGQTTTTWPGTILRFWTLFLQVMGYIITGLGLAAITGLIQRDRG